MPTYKVGRTSTQEVYQTFIVKADSEEDAINALDHDDPGVDFDSEEVLDATDGPAEVLKKFP